MNRLVPDFITTIRNPRILFGIVCLSVLIFVIWIAST